MRGLKPYCPDMMLKRHVRRRAERLGINKRIGWHTFRRSYASMLKANGEDVKVVQELLRHAKPGSPWSSTPRPIARMPGGRRTGWWRWCARPCCRNISGEKMEAGA